jgi:hypothetical protein
VIGRITASFRAPLVWDYRLGWYRPQDFVVEQGGKILNPEKIFEDWKARQQVNRNSYWYRLYNKEYEFRCDPVPMIHRHRGHKGCYYRSMKTMQERKASLAAKEDEIPWRARRNFRNLPNAWDDYPRFMQKNWKKFRKHQWK